MWNDEYVILEASTFKQIMSDLQNALDTYRVHQLDPKQRNQFLTTLAHMAADAKESPLVAMGVAHALPRIEPDEVKTLLAAIANNLDIVFTRGDLTDIAHELQDRGEIKEPLDYAVTTWEQERND